MGNGCINAALACEMSCMPKTMSALYSNNLMEGTEWMSLTGMEIQRVGCGFEIEGFIQC